MKLNTQQIKQFTSNPLQYRGALVYGPDHGLIQTRCDRIADAVLTDQDPTFNQTILTEEQLLADPSRLSDELCAMSLLGGLRLIRVKDASDKLAELVKEALSKPLENYLLLQAQELSARSRLRVVAEQAKSIAALPCYVDEGATLNQLIIQRLKQEQIGISTEALQLLTQKLPADRVAILSELNRLCIFSLGKDRITEDDVQSCFEADSESDMDRAILAFGRGDTTVLCKALDSLLSVGMQPIVIVRALDRLMMRLMELQQMVVQGMRAAEAVKVARPPIFFKQQADYVACLNYWSHGTLQAVRQELMCLEYQVKTQHDIAETMFQQRLLRLIASSTTRSEAVS